jgi:hypothetical protein
LRGENIGNNGLLTLDRFCSTCAAAGASDLMISFAAISVSSVSHIGALAFLAMVLFNKGASQSQTK